MFRVVALWIKNMKVKVIKYSPVWKNKFKRYLNESFGKKYILNEDKYISWQYSNNFYVLVVEENVIGHFGFKDVVYKVYNKKEKVRVLMNLFVLEKYRVFGLGILLIKKVFKNNNNFFVSGYRKGIVDLFGRFSPKWTQGKMNRYMFDLKNKINNQILNSSVELSNVNKINNKEFNDFWSKIKNNFPVTVDRSASYINWRFLNHYFFKYNFLVAREKGKVTGFLIWRLDGEGKYKTARISDFIAFDACTTYLLEKFLIDAKNKGAYFGEFILSSGLYDKALREVGFFETTGTKFEEFPVLLNPVSYKRKDINFGYTIDAKESDCYFTRADSDQDRPNPH